MFFRGSTWKKNSQKIIEILKKISSIEKSRIIVAFSGGSDSLFLLLVLKELQKKFHFEIIPVHINHGYLKQDDLYAKIAQLVGQKINLNVIVLKSKKVPKGVNAENFMREERFRLLEKTRKNKKAHYIAFAHHKSDLAESVLMHLMRGCGLSGLKGMEFQRGRIIRPLLLISKEDIKSLIGGTSFPYYNDKLNYDLNRKRSKIRRKLIPHLKDNFDAKIEDHLANLSQIVTQNLKLDQKRLELFFKKRLEIGQNEKRGETVSIEADLLLENQEFSCEEIIRALILKINSEEEPSYQAIVKISDWLKKNKSGKNKIRKVVFEIKKKKLLVFKR